MLCTANTARQAWTKLSGIIGGQCGGKAENCEPSAATNQQQTTERGNLVVLMSCGMVLMQAALHSSCRQESKWLQLVQGFAAYQLAGRNFLPFLRVYLDLIGCFSRALARRRAALRLAGTPFHTVI